jgi:hypothetical protein
MSEKLLTWSSPWFFCPGTAGNCKRRGGDDALLCLLQPKLRQPLERIKALIDSARRFLWRNSQDDMMIFESFHPRDLLPILACELVIFYVPSAFQARDIFSITSAG